MALTLKKSSSILLGLLILTTIAGFSQSDARHGPVYAKNGDLVLPSGYRKWVFVGGPITPNGLNDGKAPFPEFHSVYVELENVRYYQKNGKFPEGTIMVKELSLVQPGGHADGSLDSASGRGYFSGPLNGLDVMVKDSKRFSKTNNWGFFTFGHHAEPYDPTAKEQSITECAGCHIANVAKTDMVWVRYYPLLSAKIE
jgi:Cytochrome P460